MGCFQIADNENVVGSLLVFYFIIIIILSGEEVAVIVFAFPLVGVFFGGEVYFSFRSATLL